jgi:16S rRNA (uracil1498-N3)-methyltransferase
MSLYYAPKLAKKDHFITLPPEEGIHLKKVMRKYLGNKITVTNGKGLKCEAVIEKIELHQVLCRILSVKTELPPPELSIHIALSVIRPNRMDWAVEKLTELAVGTISFFYSEHSNKRKFKSEHLRKVAISAIKQSQQLFLPEIHSPVEFQKLIDQFSTKSETKKLIAHNENDTRTLFDSTIKPNQAFFIAIGPEGGFSNMEISYAESKGFGLLKLDKHVLRTETAAISAAIQIKNLISNQK